MACPSCSSPVPDGARFCPQCGAPQTEPEPLAADDEERRVVTVLFADLVGFTTLAEHRDPEQVKRLIDTVFEQLVADVESHGGVVDKMLGDAIVALFGAPVAHEDDADRAVRTGLAMQATLRSFREQHPADAVRMRIGINTGEVLVGTLAGTDYTAMGDVVNTAARIEELAPVGAVLVGDDTRSLCSPAIQFSEVEPVQLRGREQQTRVWRAVGYDSAIGGSRWDFDVQFVGREAELAMLGAVVATVRSNRSAIVAVTGEPGIGKTRLVSEALRPLLADRPDLLLLRGACAPYGEPNVWWPVTGQMLSRLGLDRGAPPDETRALVESRIRAYAEVKVDQATFDRQVELVMHLLGQPSALDALGPVATRDAVTAGIAGVLRRRAERSPVVLWIDDVQWAAPILLELLESLARQLAGLPVLLITTYRLDDGDAEWPPPVDPALTLHLGLEPLDQTESAKLVKLAAGRELPTRVIRGVTARSGGNPLFLVELARLASTGDEEPARELPGSVRALIAARLDQLPAAERAVLDNAAILGNQGRISSLREFAAELGQPFDIDSVRQLDATGLLVRDGSRWHFRSDVVREVAYHTLTKQARAQRHAGVARYLATHEPAQYDRRAHHLASAAELRAELGPIPGVPDDVAGFAVELLERAAYRWSRQGAHRRALQLVERALSLGAADGAQRRRFLLAQVENLVDLHEWRRARARVKDLIAEADAADDRVARGEAARLLGTIEQMEGDLGDARRQLGEAVDEFRKLGDDVRLAEALRARGFAEVFGGSLADAEWFLGEADALFAMNGDARGRAWVVQHRAWVSFLAGHHAKAEERLGQAIEAFRKLDDRGGTAWSSGLLAYVYHFSGRDDAAVDLARSVLDEARQWGDDWGAAMMLNLLASIRLWRGELDDAQLLADRSLAGFRRIDDRFGMIQALGTRARATVALGRFTDAERSIEEVSVLAGSFGGMAYPLTAAGGALMHLGRGERASALAAEAVDRIDTTGANVDEARALLAFGRLLADDAEAALSALDSVDVERSAFAAAARATARVITGDRVGAIADVEAVEAMEQVSYWDATMAAVAGVAATAGDERVRRCRRLTQMLEPVDDVVVVAFASEVLRRLDPNGPADDEEVTRTPIEGWLDVAHRLVEHAA